MVASRAKIRRPRSPGATGGARLRARCTKASMSERDEAAAGALRSVAAGVVLAGSLAMSRRRSLRTTALNISNEWPLRTRRSACSPTVFLVEDNVPAQHGSRDAAARGPPNEIRDDLIGDD